MVVNYSYKVTNSYTSRICRTVISGTMKMVGTCMEHQDHNDWENGSKLRCDLRLCWLRS